LLQRRQDRGFIVEDQHVSAGHAPPYLVARWPTTGALARSRSRFQAMRLPGAMEHRAVGLALVLAACAGPVSAPTPEALPPTWVAKPPVAPPEPSAAAGRDDLEPAAADAGARDDAGAEPVLISADRAEEILFNEPAGNSARRVACPSSE